MYFSDDSASSRAGPSGQKPARAVWQRFEKIPTMVFNRSKGLGPASKRFQDVVFVQSGGNPLTSPSDVVGSVSDVSAANGNKPVLSNAE